MTLLFGYTETEYSQYAQQSRNSPYRLRFYAIGAPPQLQNTFGKLQRIVADKATIERPARLPERSRR